jgi:hypothetical protein
MIAELRFLAVRPLLDKQERGESLSRPEEKRVQEYRIAANLDEVRHLVDKLGGGERLSVREQETLTAFIADLVGYTKDAPRKAAK